MAILAVGNGKGGVGKTTTSFNIVCELKPQCVIDIDISGGISICNNFRDDGKKLPITIPQTTEELIELLKTGDEPDSLVIVDCGGFDSQFTRIALAAADLIIAPTNETFFDLVGAREFNQTLQEISQQVGREIYGHMFFCKVPASKKHYPNMQDMVEHSTNLKLLESRVSALNEHHINQFRGLGVTELPATAYSRAGKEIRALCAEIKSLLQHQ
ncbi:ParA family protein [Escherichia coli]|uniref:division plane positioning ATPase MipZ n=1 Tax=Escherichia coli TaxID=562 RepID=UPI000A185703|nr:division plane positioning ATPase MipZ [Escherichia coli]EFH8163346.1 ParA family protein [Escherichia coli]EKG7113550.1 ParA family protein [Escherichia coli]EKR4920596.1 ParA family protein [Escherichia coli]ELM8776620.1 ParA family protein [Escherichia coli]EMA4402917.1 ParA family protein [Escherichia coli]